MSSQSVHGLSCPRCGGMVAIPEGQALVICPYCGQRSVVSAQEGSSLGVRRYQVPQRVGRDQAVAEFQRFLSGKVQIARDAAQQARLTEVFLVHLPFWSVWARGAAWAFGQQRVGSGDKQRYEPREKKVVRELSWNAPACEVGEFGVKRVSLKGCPLEPFDAAGLHRTGMVFEPVGSEQNALKAAEDQFSKQIRSSAELSRTGQLFIRLINTRLGLVYFPLWVVRYTYRGRSFQIVVDGFNGDVLYGKAPGSVGYRAAVLVGGMAAGAFLAIDIPSAILLSSSSDDEGPFIFALAAFAAGAALMVSAYRTFRHGEHYEYHRYKTASEDAGFSGSLTSKNISQIVDELEKL